MPFDASDEGTIIELLRNPADPIGGPSLEVRAVRTSLDLPATFLVEAAIFGTLERRGSPALAMLAGPEREALMGSLVNTLQRGTYHRGRFEQYVGAGYARFEHFEGRVVGDSVGQCILFETQALLAAMRGFVEEVLYVGARRAGEPPRDADHRAEREARNGGTLLETTGDDRDPRNIAFLVALGELRVNVTVLLELIKMIDPKAKIANIRLPASRSRPELTSRRRDSV